ncbi:MAG: DUF6883 domain-containing protein [Phycisphaerae bacterium]
MALLFEGIVVDIAKLRNYCLCDNHPRGRHKARVFRSRLGITASDARQLQESLLDAARTRQGDLHPADSDEFGRRYVLDFSMTTAVGTAVIRSTWIALTGENVLRLISCYVL